MVVDLAVAIVEIFVAIAKGVIDISLLILAASIRPLQYLFSPDFRKKTNLQFKERNNFVKVWFLFWGTISVVSSLIIVGLLLWFLSRPPVMSTKPNANGEVLQEIERSLVDLIKKAKESNR